MGMEAESSTPIDKPKRKPGRPRKNPEMLARDEKKLKAGQKRQSEKDKRAKTISPYTGKPLHPSEEMPEPGKKGRPRARFDLSKVEKLASIGCTHDEIAVFFDTTTETLKRRKHKWEDFCSAIEKGKTNFHMSLRRQQWKQAQDGNVTMLIWLGKNCLGQRDKKEIKADIEVSRERELARKAIEKDPALLDSLFPSLFEGVCDQE
jgi:hypothetical protein